MASILLRKAFVKARLDLVLEGVLVQYACVRLGNLSVAVESLRQDQCQSEDSMHGVLFCAINYLHAPIQSFKQYFKCSSGNLPPSHARRMGAPRRHLPGLAA